MNRPLVILLAASLVGNFTLLAGLFRSKANAADASPAPSATTTNGPATEAGDVSARAAAAREEDLRTGLASTDPAVVRDSLRAAGVPEPYVRAVVWARIRQAHQGDLAAIAREQGEPRYWLPRNRVAEQAARDAERALDESMRAEFTNYFGEPLGEEARARQARERLSFLPGDKAVAVTRISSDYNELRQRIRSDVFDGVMLEEDQQKLALLEKERQADLASVLTPEELELYELHTSTTASTMRTRLCLFEPSEEEFRAIFALQREYDQQFGTMYGSMSQDMLRARSAAGKQLSQQIASVLGPERATEYERSTNYAYMSAVKIADHFNLPRENAAAVYALEADFRKRVQEQIRAAPDRERAAAAAQTLAAEATSRVNALLGEEGTQAFRESGGSWLRSLEEQARRAASPGGG